MDMWFTGAVDRAARTALQVLAAYLSAAQLINEVDWRAAAAAVGFAVVLSALTSLIGSPSYGDGWGFQVVERAVKTFTQSLIAFIGTATMFDQVDWKTGLSAAALAAVYSVVTSVAATRAGAVSGEVDLSAPPSQLKES
jgi:hypothetical protein